MAIKIRSILLKNETKKRSREEKKKRGLRCPSVEEEQAKGWMIRIISVKVPYRRWLRSLCVALFPPLRFLPNTGALKMLQLPLSNDEGAWIFRPRVSILTPNRKIDTKYVFHVAEVVPFSGSVEIA